MSNNYCKQFLLTLCFLLPYVCTGVRAQMCTTNSAVPTDFQYTPEGDANDVVNTGFVFSGPALSASAYAVPVSESGNIVGCPVQAQTAMVNGAQQPVFDNVFLTRALDCFAPDPFFGVPPTAAETTSCQANIGQSRGLIAIDNTGSGNYEGFYFIVYDNGQYYRADNGGAPFSGTNVNGSFFGATSAEVPPSSPTTTAPGTTVVVPPNGFNSFAEAVANANLPVELVEFTGRDLGKSVELTWATETEDNNAGFDVERRNDSGAFEAVGSVRGRGTSGVRNEYVFVDRAPLAGLNVYRLRQNDYDGAFSYSPMVTVVATGGETRVLSVFPNPASGPVRLRVRGDWKPEFVRVTDAGGRLILSRPFSGSVDELTTAGLTPGMYQVTVTGKARAVSQRLVVR